MDHVDWRPVDHTQNTLGEIYMSDQSEGEEPLHKKPTKMIPFYEMIFWRARWKASSTH